MNPKVRDGAPVQSSLWAHLAYGLRDGAIAGLVVGVCLVLLLAITAPFYFTTTHRAVVVPVYLTVYGSVLLGVMGGGIGLAVGLSGRLIRPLGRLDARRLHRAIGVTMVPTWIVAQYVMWVAFRGQYGLKLFLAQGAVAAGALGAVVALYRVAGRRPASRVVPGVAARIAWCVYAAAALISVVLVWTRSPRADMPVIGADAGSPLQTSSLPVAAGTSGPQGDAAQPVGDDPGIADRDATDPPFEPVRHIVWISIDTLRSDRMGCYGYELPTSPHLDALAAEAVLFRNAYSHSSGTVLSFMSAHAGTDPVFVGGISQFSVLVEQVDTFVEQLQRAGYYTAAVVRQGHLNPSTGFAQGFDDYTNIQKPNRDKQVSDQAIKTLEALRNRDRTFFWFHYLDPHVPYEAPRELVEIFQRPPGTDPRLLPRYHYSSTGGINYKHVGSQYRDQIVDGRISATFVDALYDAEVRSMDEQVGRVLDRIRELGMWDETLIVVSADHGEALGEHQIYCQHCPALHEAQVRVPLIIRRPGMTRPPGVEESLVVVSDIAPTVLALAGLSAAPSMTGRTLTPFLTSESPEWAPRKIILQTAFAPGMTILLNSYRYEYPDWALIDGGYKYIYHANAAFDEVRAPLNYVNAWREVLCGHVKPDELYLLGQDGDPADNLIDRQPDLARRMRETLLSSPQIRFFREHRLSTSEGVTEEQLETLRSLGYLN